MRLSENLSPSLYGQTNLRSLIHSQETRYIMSSQRVLSVTVNVTEYTETGMSGKLDLLVGPDGNLEACILVAQPTETQT